MQPLKPRHSACLALIMSALSVGPALSHPHVFADTRTEVIGKDGELAALRHVWRFDEFFSSTVLLEFDKDANGRLEGTELEEVEGTIKRSTAEFNFFQNVYDNGREVAMTVPGRMNVSFDGPLMLLIFESVPERQIPLTGELTFGIFDPTFYTSLDFIEDKDLSANGFPAACSFALVRPNPDDAIAANQGSLTEQFFSEEKQNDYSRMFATRLEAKC
jgi:ABC-type uncharacterized transport system substrate-binding protein